MAPHRTLALFDVDGTLTVPRQAASPDMLAFLRRLRDIPGMHVGIVGGSDLAKIAEQLAPPGAASAADAEAQVLGAYDYVFAENGLVAYADGCLIGQQDLRAFLGAERLAAFVEFCSAYVADLREGVDLPVKAGRHVELRSGMLNVSPVGRACTQEQRDAFEAWDAAHHVRAAFIDALRARFPDYGLTYAVGGQISFDVVPEGWDKRFALSFVAGRYDAIHFFGDKVHPGGNDHEIYSDPRVCGHAVHGPDDTRAQCEALFLLA